MYDIVNSVAARHGVQKLIEYALLSRTLLQQTYLLYGDDHGPAIAAAREIMQALTAAGYGLVGESLALRRVADDYYKGTGLHDLAGRLRNAICA